MRKQNLVTLIKQPGHTLPKAGLRLLSGIYGAGVVARNWLYGKSLLPSQASTVPVISIGNITAGGTGKTPLCAWMMQQLCTMGKHPAYISRGYGAADQLNDEALLIQRRFPDIPVICNPDRLQAAGAALQQGADCIVLDDAFQHRRIERDRDIVTIDALCPFGLGYLLPRGLLREPLQGLGRAHYIIINRANQVSSEELAAITTTLRTYNNMATIIPAEITTKAISLLSDDQAMPADLLAGKRIIAACAIANPESFTKTLTAQGATVAETIVYDDHHSYDDNDLQHIINTRKTHRADYAVVTEKDAVKLHKLTGVDEHIVALHIDTVLQNANLLQEDLQKLLTITDVSQSSS